MDQIESKCQERALKAFGLDENVWGVNVQHTRAVRRIWRFITGYWTPGTK